MEQNTPYTEEIKVKKQSSVSLWILLILSLLGNAYLAYHFYNNNFKGGKSYKSQNADLLASIKALNFSKDSLQQEFDAVYKQFQDAASQSIASTEDKAKVVAELEQKKVQVARLLAQGGGPQLLKAKAEIETLKRELTDYQVKMETMRSDFDRMAGEKAQLEQATEEAAQKVAKAEEEKADLKQKINNSSFFQVSEMKVIPQRTKRGAKEATLKASKVEQISIKFELIPSDIIDLGSKSVSIRILGTNGEVLTNDNDVLQDSDQLVTHKHEFNFTGEPESVSFTFKQKALYKKGEHTIEIIQDGKLLTRADFMLE